MRIVVNSGVGIQSDINSQIINYSGVQNNYNLSGLIDVTSFDTLSLFFDIKRIPYTGYRDSVNTYWNSAYTGNWSQTPINYQTTLAKLFLVDYNLRTGVLSESDNSEWANYLVTQNNIASLAAQAAAIQTSTTQSINQTIVSGSGNVYEKYDKIGGAISGSVTVSNNLTVSGIISGSSYLGLPTSSASAGVTGIASSSSIPKTGLIVISGAGTISVSQSTLSSGTSIIISGSSSGGSGGVTNLMGVTGFNVDLSTPLFSGGFVMSGQNGITTYLTNLGNNISGIIVSGMTDITGLGKVTSIGVTGQPNISGNISFIPSGEISIAYSGNNIVIGNPFNPPIVSGFAVNPFATLFQGGFVVTGQNSIKTYLINAGNGVSGIVVSGTSSLGEMYFSGNSVPTLITSTQLYPKASGTGLAGSVMQDFIISNNALVYSGISPFVGTVRMSCDVGMPTAATSGTVCVTILKNGLPLNFAIRSGFAGNNGPLQIKPKSFSIAKTISLVSGDSVTIGLRNATSTSSLLLQDGEIVIS